MNEANGNGVMGILLVFGPCHGKHIIWPSGPLPDPLIVMDDTEPPRFFQEYREGQPFGMERPSMMAGRHFYTQKDIYDNGMEECAIYFHSDECCEKDYSKSEPFAHYQRQNKPPMQPPITLGPNSQEFVDMVQKIQQRTAEVRPQPPPPQLKPQPSQKYKDAVQKMAELIEREKEGNDRTD